MASRERDESDRLFMRAALRLAMRGYGETSPNPMVGAILVKKARIIGQGWHRRAGEAHAEIEAICDAQSKGHSIRGATLYVTLEPCSTYGRTPPCTEAIVQAGIRRVVTAVTDPNPRHAGEGFRILKKGGVRVTTGILARKAERMNEAFNQWIVHRTPFVIVKAAMSLDGKIATISGESKWITSEPARAQAMKLRQGVDAILVGVNTVLADDPRLTFRPIRTGARSTRSRPLRRIILDSKGRLPLDAHVAADEFADWTTVVTSKLAPKERLERLKSAVNVWAAPLRNGKIDLDWLLRKLGQEGVTSVLVEGGGEVNASFLLGGHAHRVVFFYAPKVLGGAHASKAVGGVGVERATEVLDLCNVEWRRLGPDLMLTGLVSATFGAKLD